MYEKEFELLWLSQNEAKIYQTLLVFWELSVWKISTHSGIHRRNVYDVADRLLEKWLIFQILMWKETIYHCVEPAKFLEILKEKENSFKEVLPRLEKIYNDKPPSEAVYIYKWLEWYKNYLRDLIRVWETTYFLWAKALWFTPWTSMNFLKQFQEEIKKKNLKYYTIFDPRVPEKIPDAIKTVSWEYKILPKWYETPAVCDIFWDYVVTFSSVWVWNFWKDWSIFVMKNKELAESYRTWFKFIWDFCPKN